MRLRACFLVILGLVLIAPAPGVCLADDPGEPDTCRIQCPDVTLPGEQVEIGVTVYNDEDLGGLAVPLVFGHPTLDVVCDSIGFAGTRVEHAEYRGAAIDTADYKLVFYVVFYDSHLVAGDGVVANMYFTTGPGWDSTLCVRIDTAFHPPTTVLEFTPVASGQAAHPEFIRGCLALGATPVPELAEPADEAVMCSPDTFDLVWSDLDENLSYTLQYAQDSNFTSGVVTIGDLQDTNYTVSLPRGTYFWHVKSGNVCGKESPYQEQPFSFSLFQSGDATNDGLVDLSDAITILNYLYKSGPEPNPLGSGDANCDDVVDLGDAVWLLNYLFKAGPTPCCP
jgi:hypothetical protein